MMVSRQISVHMSPVPTVLPGLNMHILERLNPIPTPLYILVNTRDLLTDRPVQYLFIFVVDVPFAGLVVVIDHL